MSAADGGRPPGQNGLSGAPRAPGLTRRRLLAGAGSAGLTLAAGYYVLRASGGAASVEPRVDVRRFGASGDGRTNDTAAFAAASKALTQADGGTLVIPPGVYVVGAQRRAGRVAFSPHPIIAIRGCRRPVVIEGNGARLVAASGLRLGAFNPADGTPFEPPALPFFDLAYRADAYGGMVEVERNADVTVRGLRLDGRAARLRLGGSWGDAGRQCWASGIQAYANRRLTIDDVHAYDHGLDGITIGFTGMRPDSPPAPCRLTDVRLERNARQALSVVGAADLRAERCVFADTGTGPFMSPPGAGVDLEPEESSIRDVTFDDCRFTNNRGPGLVIASSGPVSGVRIADCTLEGSPTGAALWPPAAAVVVERCTVSGWVTNAFGSPDPTLATRFVECRFDDRLPAGSAPPMIGAALVEVSGQNVSLVDCRITATRGRSLWIDDATTRERLDGCVVEHRAQLPPGDFQALVRGAAVARSRFTVLPSSPPPQPWHVNVQDVQVGPEVVVEGPSLTWGPGGPVGRIPAS